MGSHTRRISKSMFPSLYPFRFILSVSNSIQDACMNGAEQAREDTNQRFGRTVAVVQLLRILSVTVAASSMHS